MTKSFKCIGRLGVLHDHWVRGVQAASLPDEEEITSRLRT
uniref:Uncharacterized protein n=1 Tax=Anguilla anguilla TaxID=7936 RepID=A0A0E9PQ13_ANGAN